MNTRTIYRQHWKVYMYERVRCCWHAAALACLLACLLLTLSIHCACAVTASAAGSIPTRRDRSNVHERGDRK